MCYRRPSWWPSWKKRKKTWFCKAPPLNLISRPWRVIMPNFMLLPQSPQLYALFSGLVGKYAWRDEFPLACMWPVGGRPICYAVMLLQVLTHNSVGRVKKRFPCFVEFWEALITPTEPGYAQCVKSIGNHDTPQSL